MISGALLGCSTARNKGTCDNRTNMRREELELQINVRGDLVGIMTVASGSEQTKTPPVSGLVFMMRSHRKFRWCGDRIGSQLAATAS